jgi:hypothetical protein
MQYHCSRCHHVFDAPAEADGHGGELRCPACKAEAGLEKAAKTPLPMFLFAGFLAGALLAAVVGGALTLTSGG